MVGLLLAVLPPGLASPNDQPLLPTGRYIVGFAELSEADLSDGTWHGYPVVRTNPALDTALVQVTTPLRFLLDAGEDDNVLYTEWDDPRAYATTFTPNDPRYADQYGLRQVRADAAWDTTLGSTAVRVAVLDTGVEADHEDLAGRVALQADFVNGDGLANDDCGHGTHVAGTVAAHTDNGKGVAGTAQVTLLVGKVLSPFLILQCSGSHADIADGITWAADNGAHVLSLSLGGTSGSTTLQNAVRYAWDNGVLIVAAAGNGGSCSDCVQYPAKYPEVVAVTCTVEGSAQCSFSSDGPESELSAPGNAVWSTYTGGGYRSLSGTSMSTPHVSGVAALALSVDPTLTNAALRDLLAATARDRGAAGWDERFGHGEVDAAALLASLEAEPEPPENLPPTASIEAACEALACRFDASASEDPDGSLVSFTWELGDGTNATGALVDHTYDAAGTYTVSVRVTDDDGASASHVASITVEGGGGGADPVAGLAEDFEGDLDGWTASDPSGPASWALTNTRSSSPSHAMALRVYGADEDDALTSPAVALTGLSEPTLTVRSWIEGERGCFLFSCSVYDHGHIEVTADGGATWRTLASGLYSSGGAWQTLTYDLSPEAGEVVAVRFTFSSDGSVHKEGWYLDDIVIG